MKEFSIQNPTKAEIEEAITEFNKKFRESPHLITRIVMITESVYLFLKLGDLSRIYLKTTPSGMWVDYWRKSQDQTLLERNQIKWVLPEEVDYDNFLAEISTRAKGSVVSFDLLGKKPFLWKKREKHPYLFIEFWVE